MSVFAVFLAITMSSFIHSSTVCKHGIHMHVIWNSTGCRAENPGRHMIPGGGSLLIKG